MTLIQIGGYFCKRYKQIFNSAKESGTHLISYLNKVNIIMHIWCLKEKNGLVLVAVALSPCMMVNAASVREKLGWYDYSGIINIVVN